MGRIFDDLEVEEERPDYAGAVAAVSVYLLYFAVLLPRSRFFRGICCGTDLLFSFPFP